MKKIFTTGVVLLSLLILRGSVGHAQTSGPQAFITWQAIGGYAPSSYKGKVLPEGISQILASVQVISQGKLVDLKNQVVDWYIDGDFLSGGLGMQSVVFPAATEAPGTVELKVEIPNYDNNLLDVVNIPIIQPVVVLATPYPNNQFSDNPLTLTALPYFFNAPSLSSLAFSWSVNNQTGSNAENPYVAEITLPQGTSAGTTINVSLSVQDPLDGTTASVSKVLTYQ